MKRVRVILIIAIVFALVSPAAAYSYYGGMLSPALMNLSEEVTMVKSGLVSGDITFTAEDFKTALGGTVDSITVTALPPQASGTLMLGNAPVLTNQIISAVSLNKLKFVPGKDCTEASFRFKSGGEYSVGCIIKYMDSVNLAPVIAKADSGNKAVSAGLRMWTQQDISTYGSLSASDPEGDEITFEILEYPEHGILKLTNKSKGDYCYTPCDGVTGEDSFSYIVRDEWGNYSEKASVIIDIEKPAADLVFADMSGHWAHNAALVMAAENAMHVESIDGSLYFHPDEEVTREEFLVTVMKALGAGEIEPCTTVFADNSLMQAESTGYISRAYDLGIIKGISDGGKLCFKPTDSITRAEAAVILNAIIGANEPDTVPVFADNSAVPAWARASLYALSDAGIFAGTGSGNISPNSPLSRAQTAQILLTVKKIYQ